MASQTDHPYPNPREADLLGLLADARADGSTRDHGYQGRAVRSYESAILTLRGTETRTPCDLWGHDLTFTPATRELCCRDCGHTRLDRSARPS